MCWETGRSFSIAKNWKKELFLYTLFWKIIWSLGFEVSMTLKYYVYM